MAYSGLRLKSTADSGDGGGAIRRSVALSQLNFLGVSPGGMIGRILLLAAVGFVFVLPVVRLVAFSFTVNGAFSLDAWADMLSRAGTWKSVGNSLFISLASTAVSLCVGTLLAWLVACTDIRFTRAIQFLAFLPFILPSYTIALAWRLFVSPNGALAGLLAMLPGSPAPPGMYNYGGIVFMHSVTSFPPVFLLVQNALRRSPREMELAAMASGASPAEVFFKINLPVIAPTLAGAGALSFLLVLDNFGIAAMLGIPAGIRVLPTYIYEQIAGMGKLAFSRGAVLSVLLILLSLIAPAFQRMIRVPMDVETVRPRSEARVLLGGLRLPVSILAAAALSFISVVPVVSMIGTALKNATGLPLSASNFTLSNLSFVLLENAKSRRALMNSLFLALSCTAFCMFFGTALAAAIARGKSRVPRIIETMVQIPYSMPGIVLSLCMILFWMQPLPGVFPGFYGTYRILLIVYVTRFLIVQSKASYTAIAGFDRDLRDSARISGSSAFTCWRRIVLPLLWPAILSGAIMVFIGIFTELTLSSLLWSAGSETIGSVILNFEQSGAIQYSSALSTVVCLSVTALFLLSALTGWEGVRRE